MMIIMLIIKSPNQNSFGTLESESGPITSCAFVQEGGYKMDTVGEAALDVLGGFATGISSL